MYAVIGYETGKIYYEHQYKSACFSWINEHMAKRRPLTENSCSRGAMMKVDMPEPLMISKEKK